MPKRLKTAIVVLACAALVYPAIALAKTVQVSGYVKGQEDYPTGRVALSIKVNGEGEPTKVLDGSFANIDTTCDQGGANINAQGYGIGPTNIKKDGSKFKFKWEGESPPQSKVAIEGTVKKDAAKVKGTLDVVYDVSSSPDQEFLCRTTGVRFTIKPEGDQG